MALFKILKGHSSRIDMSITPFHDGYAYFTANNGDFYIDSEDNGKQKRIRITPQNSGGSTAITSTLLASGWSGGRQTLTIEGVAADSNGVIGVTQDTSDAQMEATKNAALYVCTQGNATLTVAVFAETPACDFPVVVILLG